MAKAGWIQVAAAFLVLAALFQVVAVVLNGFGDGDAVRLGLAALAALAAAGLWRGWRWLGWPVLVAALVAAGVAFGGLGTEGPPDIVRLAMAGADLGAAICLFVALWKGRSREAAGVGGR